MKKENKDRPGYVVSLITHLYQICVFLKVVSITHKSNRTITNLSAVANRAIRAVNIADSIVVALGISKFCGRYCKTYPKSEFLLSGFVLASFSKFLYFIVAED